MLKQNIENVKTLYKLNFNVGYHLILTCTQVVGTLGRHRGGRVATWGRWPPRCPSMGGPWLVAGPRGANRGAGRHSTTSCISTRGRRRRRRRRTWRTSWRLPTSVRWTTTSGTSSQGLAVGQKQECKGGEEGRRTWKQWGGGAELKDPQTWSRYKNQRYKERKKLWDYFINTYFFVTILKSLKYYGMKW